MSRVKNRGVSMVEILISIAIFAILMIPIVSGIISAMHNTTQAKTLQYRNEYAENLMEYVKEESLVNILDGDYLSSIGSYDNNVSIDFYKDTSTLGYDSNLKAIVDLAKTKSWTLNETTSDITSGVGADRVYYPYENYMISGKVKLGTEHTTYSYKMQVSNKYYAEKEASSSYANPNNLALGIVEDIDHTKVALINGTIANYDTAVSNAFMTKKLEILKRVDPTVYDQYINQVEDVTLFPEDTATRVITVKVSGSEKTGYKVTCSLSYKDNCETRDNVATELGDYTIEYVPFEYNYPVDSNTGKAELPNIYLMYNVCLYNGKFAADDYIVIDTSDVDVGLGVDDNETEVNCFIVQTAETYSQNLTDANPTLNNSKILYNNRISAGGDTREDTNIHLLATMGSKLKNLSVYHNFDITPNADVNKKSSKVLYKNTDTLLTNGLTGSYVALVAYTGGTSEIDPANSVAHFASLDSAKEENRGLYEVKLWLVESDNINDVDTSKSPVMTGTKGGNES